jgi:hypothetical protein
MQNQFSMSKNNNRAKYTSSHIACLDLFDGQPTARQKKILSHRSPAIYEMASG